MNGNLLAVADLGHLKVYRVDANPKFSRPRLELMEDWQTNARRHLNEEVTDQAGRFRKNVSRGPSALSDGEAHHLDQERHQRAVREVARHITRWIDREHAKGFYLAADSRINRRILGEMDSNARAKLKMNVLADLARSGTGILLQHFRA
jgi:protein required for attachment to host cells